MRSIFSLVHANESALKKNRGGVVVCMCEGDSIYDAKEWIKT